MSDKRTLQHILHPSDNSDDSLVAFAHALKIALSQRADLTLVHSDTDPTNPAQWWHPPGVRRMLADWGLLEGDVPRQVVAEKLGVAVNKTRVPAKTPVAGVAQFLDDLSADLVVVATEGRSGLSGWLKPSVAEKVSRRTDASTLFIQRDTKRFVALNDGSLSLSEILIPIDHEPDAARAISVVTELLSGLGVSSCTLRSLHVGVQATCPPVQIHEHPGWHWQHIFGKGEVVSSIIDAAEKFNTDLIVMATAGRHGFLEAMHGSTTEQIVRRGPCPVLAVPARLS